MLAVAVISVPLGWSSGSHRVSIIQPAVKDNKTAGSNRVWMWQTKASGGESHNIDSFFKSQTQRTEVFIYNYITRHCCREESIDLKCLGTEQTGVGSRAG